MTKDKYYWLNDDSRLFLKRGYLAENQTAEERIKQIADHAEKLTGIQGFSEKFEDYMSRGWFSLSSPVWANYGTDRGLPVSCFGSYIEDDMASILATHAEVGMLSKFGGGTSGYFGSIRPRGAMIDQKGQSSGSVHFMELFDKLTNVVSQGSVRRGFFSTYLPIEHEDFDEFVGIGSEGHSIQNLTHGVTVSDAFMDKMIAGDSEARRRWAKVIQMRSEAGYPYIFWSDTVNKNKPEVFEDKTIWASNMCTEIALPSSKDETFVCVLSSMNLLHYDEWKDTDAVETLTIFLDSVCTEFINVAEEMRKTKPQAIAMIDRALNFCKRYRALGLGVLGFHSYLQSKMIPFESREAAKWNLEMIKLINGKAQDAREQMFRQRDTGEALNMGNYNATLLAIAPTKSSSFILGGVSQGIEPEWSNYYIKDLAKTKVTQVNPYLKQLLIEKDKDTYEVWQSIKEADGSVQHLDFLSQREKDTFKTFIEINPETIIDYAATRQPYIDQAQSINLMIDPNMPTREINKLYIKAWQSGLKTLYYQYSLNAAQASKREKYMKKGCAACEA
jgi:ribonucleoside-diphosphate reductase alpha chain